MAIHVSELRWQQTGLARLNELRELRLLSVVTAWGFFLWQAMQLPVYAQHLLGGSPLLLNVIGQGRGLPDLGLILTGMIGFHFCRLFRQSIKRPRAFLAGWRVALWLFVALVLAIAVPGALKVLAGIPLQALPPWLDPMTRPQFLVLGFCLILSPFVSFLLFNMWTGVQEIPFSVPLVALGLYGLIFWAHWDLQTWFWLLRVPLAVILGMALMSMIFRVMRFVVVVRPHLILIGLFGLIGGAVLPGIGLFFAAFVLIACGLAMSERDRLPGEGLVLAWSLTAPSVFILAPIALTVVSLWGDRLPLSAWSELILAAILTQILAIPLLVLVQRPLLHPLTAEQRLE